MKHTQHRNGILLGLETVNAFYDDMFRNPVNICEYVENDNKHKLYQYGLSNSDIEYLYARGHSQRERKYMYQTLLLKVQEEKEAVIKIQNAYLNAYYNPRYRLCKVRLKREFEKLQNEISIIG
jgi:hypothetical protein